MADNIISQYYTKNDGSQIGNDAQLINGVYQNEKIINKNSGEKFVKSSNYRNVFDKVDETISKIDYDKAKRAFLCKNASGVEVDTFSYSVPVLNYGPTLKWDELNEIGKVDGTSLMVRMPPKYSAGAGLVLNGTQFSISQDLLDKINNSGGPSGPSGPSGPVEKYYYYNKSLNVGDVISGSYLHVANDSNSGTVTGTWELLWFEDIRVPPNTQGLHSDFDYRGRFRQVG